MAGPVLEFNDVSVGFGQNIVIGKASCSFSPGNIIGLAGPNGSGKSTFLKSACGLLELLGGEVTFTGSGISYMPQELAIYSDLTAFENVSFFRDIGQGNSLFSPEELLSHLKIKSIAKKRISHVSGGMARAVSLASAIVMGGDLYLFDEPTAGFDNDRIQRAWALFRQLAQEHIVIVATHNHEVLDRCEVTVDIQSFSPEDA